MKSMMFRPLLPLRRAVVDKGNACLRRFLGVPVLLLVFQCCVFTNAHAQAFQAERSSELEQALSQETGLSLLEIKTALEEIQAMERTYHAMVVGFPARSSTPEQIGRLLEAPSFKRLSTSDRQNALIFGGLPGATFLTFERPSDVIRRGERWFSDELNSVRRGEKTSSLVKMMGPYAHWSVEAAAFAAVWNCMPRSIWQDPAANPFDKFSVGLGVMFPLDYKDGADADDAVFSRCVREWSGRETGIPTEQHEQLDALALRVEHHLKTQFAEFLRRHRCQGTGADDCVLVLHWWSSLAPDDPQLARWLQELATDVGMDSPLPELIEDRSGFLPPSRGQQPRYAQAWRRAAFVHSKIQSLLSVPAAWPVGALDTSLREMDDMGKAVDGSSYAYGMPLSFNPWPALWNERRPEPIQGDGTHGALSGREAWALKPRDASTIRTVDQAVWTLLEERSTAGCETEERWLTTRMIIDWLRGTLAEGRPTLPTCLRPDLEWLSRIGDESAEEVLTLVRDALGHARPSMRDQLMTLLTNDGETCWRTGTETRDRRLSTLCQAWIPDSARARFYPVVSPTGRSESGFLEHSLAFPSDQTEEDRRRSLRGLVEGMPKRTRQQFERWLATRDHALTDYESAAIWRHDRHSRALVRLTLFNQGNPIDGYFLMSPSGVVPIVVPARFTESSSQSLVKVSDQDHDGRLELWWANRYDVQATIQSDTACDGEDESDLERDMFCRKFPAQSVQAVVGEINGNVFTQRVLGKKATPPRFEHWSFVRNVSRIPASWRQSVQADQSCNRLLIGQVLGPQLAITDWSDASEDPRRVVRLVCKQHPLRADQTLVALFHEIPGSYDPYDVRPYGFAFAVLDMGGRRVMRLYQSTLEEDGGTNISGGDLKIDTGRYWLKKGTRALGVRMDIARMPSAPDSYASHFLTLFVEEGATLRPVLERFPMYHWRIHRTGDCVDRQWANEERGDQVCEDESVNLSLTLGATRPNGWRDLVVVGAGEGEESGSSSARRATLTYTNGQYTGSALDGW
jgi:hypothetical protein